jgi:UDP-N-acetylmuramoyl-L-alanine---L-glutamate ligase
VRFSELDGAHIGVWGAGREIGSFARQLARRLPSARIEVVALDAQPAAGTLDALGLSQASLAIGDEALGALSRCEVVVRSPGVSIHRPELVALSAAGIPVTTATSLWLAEREGRRVIGVTGTKGKSTTAALTHHLATAAGVPSNLAGNIGVPALDLLDADPQSTAVVELSSFQIADLERAPAVAVVTNLYREHADWHGSEGVYRAEKLRLLELPGIEHAVLPARQRELASASTYAERHLFGLPEGWDVSAEGVTHAGTLVLAVEQLALPGEHNALNLCAALTALQAAGLPLPRLPAALEGFRALEHRLQTVAERDGVSWVDDSISTTPESALAALASFPDRPVVLLAGGQDRGQDYGPLAEALARRSDVTLIALPSTGPRLRVAALSAGLEARRALAAEDLPEAVGLARELAEPGAVVMLSPAAPSFDRYRDFQERGERFRALLELN